MNIRRVEVLLADGRILLRLHTGHATEATAITAEIDPATALVAAGKLEAAVHTVCPEGMPEISSPS